MSLNNQRRMQAIVESSATFDQNTNPVKLALFNEDGSAFEVETTTDNLDLDGYEISASTDALPATGISLNEAIGRLEARIVALELAAE